MQENKVEPQEIIICPVSITIMLGENMIALLFPVRVSLCFHYFYYYLLFTNILIVPEADKILKLI